MITSHTASEGSFSFEVEIKLSASDKGAALETLLRVLNSAGFSDYRITSGVQLDPSLVIPEQTSVKSQQTLPQSNVLYDRIHEHIQSNRLIRLSINKGRGVKMNIPCRFLNFDPSNQQLTVYHVDEKQVYSINLNEIEDFIE
jgi:hypothetical protein